MAESEHELARHRLSAYAVEVLRPAVYGATAPLAVEAFQCAEPVPHDAAVAADYRPVAVGWDWGPRWSTCWFRLTGRVPQEMDGRPVALRFSSGTEALLWIDGAPARGFDANRDTWMLADPARAGDAVRLHVEAACNHPFGIAAFSWDPPETRARWESDTPGRLERCELAVHDEAAWRLWRSFDFARRLLAELEETDPRAHALRRGLEAAVRRVDDRAVGATADAARAAVEDALATGAAPSATRCVAVGHAHIDTAWLWPIRETRRKCLRSFANALELMERDPSFVFLCSQPQQYAWVERDSPALFARIADRVAEGRWEPAGAMWVEPDCNVPSGESLVRQVLHGTRWWTDRFGDRGRQRLLYLPDTFGFPASLPQIMAGAGLDTFVTNKLSWCERNAFPHTSFRWRGIDGTEVLAHCTPGHDYNARLSPVELRRGETNAARGDRGRTGLWLQPFGFGDGGGGPTAGMLHDAHLAAACEGLPRVELGGTARFCDDLHAARAALRARGEDLPAWDGELYLELHRGTYTTQSRLKVANRRAEIALRSAEWLAFAGPAPIDEATGAEIRGRLDETWKTLLLNQFHDILPGSSIPEVYVDAHRDHGRIARVTGELVEGGIARWAEHADTRGLAEPMLVLNPTSAPASGVVACDGRLHHVEDVPALGARVVDRAAPSTLPGVETGPRRLANGHLAVELDDAGRLVSLRGADGREAARPGEPMNQLVLYEDRPRGWDAWDIEATYAEKPTILDGPAARIEVVADDPLRGAIEVERDLGAGDRIVQRYVLDAGSSRLDVRTRIEWSQRHRLLRALFPVDVRARRATYEIQFGHVERPTHRSTSRDAAMFEVCAHAWMDLAEPGLGVALLNDGRYGHSCEDHVMGLTLVRGPRWPDPEADAGVHEFTYALVVHEGDWRQAGVDRDAHALNAPLLAHPLPAGRAGVIAPTWASCTITTSGPDGVVVPAIKPAEDGDGLVVRLVETHGGRCDVALDWALPVSAVAPVDLLERPADRPGLAHDAAGRRTTLTLRPFEIATLAVATA
ncbi:MAG: alpha-mannosidase [Planctomycetota bacterium]|jgi:alpha-mannosidase